MKKYKVLFFSATAFIAVFLFLLWSSIQGIGFATTQYSQVDLSKEEKAWVRDHPVIRVGCAPDWPPFLFFNERGEEVGIAREYMDLVSANTGLKFEHIYFDRWAEVLEAAKKREIDVISTINENPQRSRYLYFTDSYFTVDIVIIGTSDMRENLTFEDLSNLRVATVQNNAVMNYLHERYPEIHLIGVEDEKSGIEGVAFHKYDVFIGDLASCAYYIDELILPTLRVVGRTPLEYNIRIGSRRDWPILSGILNRGLNKITPAQRESIFTQWVKLLPGQHPLWPQLLIILGCVLAILVLLVVAVSVILIWNRVLRQKVAVRTQELNYELEEHKRTENALRESEAHFRKYFELGLVGMAIMDPHGRFVEVNDELCKMLGYKADQLKQTAWVSVVHTDDLPACTNAMRALVRENQQGITEDKRFVRQDGAVIYTITSMSTLRLSDGRVSKIIALIQDISQRKAQEIKQNTMMQELDHRVKNNLAEVLALADHTLNRVSTLDEFRDAYLTRVRSMARTHEIMAEAKWDGIEISKLIEVVLGAHYKEGMDRITTQGESILLPSRTCQPLCMTLNELSANAAKYGALSVHEGKIELFWELKGNNELHLVWREKNGPPVKKPTRIGVGSKLMRGLIEYELQGKLEFSYPMDGMICEITIRLAQDKLTAKH